MGVERRRGRENGSGVIFIEGELVLTGRVIRALMERSEPPMRIWMVTWQWDPRVLDKIGMIRSYGELSRALQKVPRGPPLFGNHVIRGCGRTWMDDIIQGKVR